MPNPCYHCGYCWSERPGEPELCHYDDPWPAPCEHEEEYDEEEGFGY